MNKLGLYFAFLLPLIFIFSNTAAFAQNVFYVNVSDTYVVASNLNPIPKGGDIIKILAVENGSRETLKFIGFEGNKDNPILFINDGGQVNIVTGAWGALTFQNCKYIKVSGKGDPNIYYGFKLTGIECGLAFSEYSSDCEAEFVEIEGSGDTFFGIFAKKDFQGNPTIPYPVFNKLNIHDTYIHNVDEGMYIGETTSPGMEFHHLRIYNNVVENTFRESIQIANSVNDIEIYNNLFLNSGIANLDGQNNGLQIGANSIAKVYNNIIINSPGYGAIVLGNGDIMIKNNFIQNNKGVFIDNRFTPLSYSPIKIEENFIDQTNAAQIIENRNEFNDLFFLNNIYSSDILFFKNSVQSSGLLEVTNNRLQTIDALQYSLVNGIFQNSSDNPIAYRDMGPKIGLSHIYNESPILQTIDNILIDCSTSRTIKLSASVADQDILHFEERDLPEFAQINEISSGEAELILNPGSEKGIYEFGILVYDESHHAYDRQVVQLSVINPDNQAPVLNFDTNLSVEAASKSQFNITAIDADNDIIYYSVDLLPSFVKIITNIEGETFFDIQPKISDIGEYSITVIADDKFGTKASHILNLSITQPILYTDRIIYRVNFGGPEIEAEPINWESDINSPVYGATDFPRTGSWSWNGFNTTSAPNDLFGPFRYDKEGAFEMQFAFPLTANGRYKIKLFFAERSTELNANTTGTFNVFLENTKVLDKFNIYEIANFDALEKSFEVLVEDKILNLDFQQLLNNTKINGIEISYLDEGILIPPTIERIPLNTSMITDLVDKGSRYSPIYLVNEQNNDPYSNQHPKSKSWLPSKYASKGPFQAIIDLGEEYFIDYAFLHDMQFEGDLHISKGTPDNWIEILTYSTSLNKQWKELSLKSTSRYLLLSMINTIYAQINEIALYGYPINQTNKSDLIWNENKSPEFVIYPNPAKNQIQIQNKSEYQTVEIININSKVMLQTQENLVDISQLPNGIYLLRLYEYGEVVFQNRFIKM